MKRSLLDSRIEATLAATAPIEEDRPRRCVTMRDHSRFVALGG
jgi:hypothetical protein